eukprot:gb/GECG01011925.1/.p1 GENE.gb/GECG01011925.1/~~gb/GECG01011925.1/.p1  ORF type:complete len:901 (+),score=82.58 gb/GECG01011925.1/:1-2703(+)
MGKGDKKAPPGGSQAPPVPAVGDVLSTGAFEKDAPGQYPKENTNSLSYIMEAALLGMICIIAFAIRLFAVVRWESIIHEFDPWFNFRTTKYLANEGFYDFLNWFDDRSWYPLGRIVGGTIYPGLMSTAAALHQVLNSLNITVNVRNVCVFLAPMFASLTAIAAYLLTKEVTKRSSTGVLAAALVAIVPSYISRSVGGSYDNEGVAIFALIFTFYLWVKAVNTGSLSWAAACALSYFYMVAAWGGFVFIINVIPIYVVLLIFSGRYSTRLYIAYSTFYVLGSLLAMQVPFVGFNVVRQAECAASHGVFILIQVVALYRILGADKINAKALRGFIFGTAATLVLVAAGTLIGLQLLGYTQWTGRSLTLLDPTYAKKYIPIIASVSEHQPTAWTSFFFDLHATVPFAPVGLYFLFQNPTDAKIFLILYGTLAWYFAGVMVRLMLTLAPVACILAAVGISGVLNTFLAHLKMSVLHQASEDTADETSTPPDSGTNKKGSKSGTGKKKESASFTPVSPMISLLVTYGLLGILIFYSQHTTFVASEAYSSPSVVLASRRMDGTRVIMDDFREAYYWLRMNTAPDAKIMSWWDYGYQMSGIANRTVLVDNNTWNNTHIATVGRAMSSREEEAYPIMQSLDVDYVLAIFGGVTGYQSDDINKFLWMVRIGGGVFPHIKEPDYFSGGNFRVDSQGSSTLLNCMMYKMCYYRFDEMPSEFARPGGFDRARNVEIGNKGFELTHLDEAFTSEHWIVRIYKVKKPDIADANSKAPSLNSPTRFKRATSPTYKDTKPEPTIRYVGCFNGEGSFPGSKQYMGGATGANFNLAKQGALSRGKRFFAVARNGEDGHSFAFDSPPLVKPDGRGAGCERACLDTGSRSCGCSDLGCGDEPTPPGEEHNRRWVVYEIRN